MSRATNVPAVPSPTADNLLQVARALKQMVDVREGLTGDPLDANVTFRDLVDVGAVKVNPASNGRTGNIVLPAWVENDGYDPTGDFLSPPKPENVSVTGLFAMVQIQWDEPTYRNHAYAEIWRSDTNVLGNAVLIGTSDSSFYVDNLGTGATKFYWVRFVSQANVKGPYNSTTGIQGATSVDPTYLMDVLSDAYGSTSAAPFFQIDQATVINGVSIPAGTYIKQAFIADATISRAKIQLLAVDDARIASINAAKITAGTIDADRIGANTITADKIDSRNLTIKDSAGNIIFSASGTSYTNISGLGTLATQNTVSTGQVTGLGSFATLNQINTGNISTYIAAGAIGNAYIGNFISSTNFNGSIDASGSITSNGTTGWAIGKAGTAVFNAVTLRGELLGGSFTGYAWPSGSGTGFYLGPNGLLLGNQNTGKYVAALSTGDFYLPGMSVVNGNLTIDKVNVIDTLQIRGNAVTISGAASGVYSATATVNITDTAAVSVIGTFTQGNLRNGLTWYLQVDSTLVQFENPRDGTLGAMSKLVNLTPGTHTFTIYTNDTVGDAACGITVLATKR